MLTGRISSFLVSGKQMHTGNKHLSWDKGPHGFMLGGAEALVPFLTLVVASLASES